MSAQSPTTKQRDRGSAAPWLRVATHFAGRELRERFLGSVTGAAWALLAPVIQLLVLLLVFGMILKVRLPEADPRAFLPFLVAGLWPWVAFSDAIGRGMGAVVERAALISKVAVPRSALVLAPVLASFALHGVGFVVVLVVVAALGYPLELQGLLLAVPLWLGLGAFAFGLALFLATLRVFVPDTAHVVPQLLTLWFYLTPIFYPLSFIPESLRQVVLVNPMTAYVGLFRAAFVGEVIAWPLAIGVAVIATVAMVALGGFVFRRASRHFEDFL